MSCTRSCLDGGIDAPGRDRERHRDGLGRRSTGSASRTRRRRCCGRGESAVAQLGLEARDLLVGGIRRGLGRFELRRRGVRRGARGLASATRRCSRSVARSTSRWARSRSRSASRARLRAAVSASRNSRRRRAASSCSLAACSRSLAACSASRFLVAFVRPRGRFRRPRPRPSAFGSGAWRRGCRTRSRRLEARLSFARRAGSSSSRREARGVFPSSARSPSRPPPRPADPSSAMRPRRPAPRRASPSACAHATPRRRRRPATWS